MIKRRDYMFKAGDKVLFNYYNESYTGTDKDIKSKIGIILYNHNNYYTILQFDDYKTNIIRNVKLENICSIDDIEIVKTKIYYIYDKLLANEKLKLKFISQVEKDEEKLQSYNSIKYRIIKNCEWLIKSDLDDEDFINRVKEIANLKKQLFTQRLECVDEIHKYNGTIKFNYKKIENERNKLLKCISDETINKYFKDM